MKKKLFKKRNQLVDKQEKKKFIKNLYKIGYSKNILFNKYKYLKLLTTAFQRRFRQELVNGTIDQECLFISNNLAKNLK
jgi:N-acetylmuramoyl-L-alanine amidase